MSNALQVFNFEKRDVRVVIRGSDPWWVAKDVCDVLGYENSRKALADHIDEDEKGVTKCDTLGGMQEMSIINESGLYALVMRSNKPEAKRFRKWVTSEVLPALRKTGSYSVKKAPDEERKLEIARQRIALQEKNANARLAKIMQRMVEHPAYELTKESKRILAHEITHLTTGREHLEMLPDAETRYYSAKQIGDEAGVSSRRVMKAAREMGLVAPEGQGNEYGRWKMTKSPYSPHECAQWSFSEAGRQKVLEALLDAA